MKKYRSAILFFSIMWLPATIAWAEGNCPSGYYPIGGGNGGWNGCAPMSSGSGSGSGPANPGASWATRWGAIATDRVGTFGTEGLASKRQAKSAALAECKKHGGKNARYRSLTIINAVCLQLAKRPSSPQPVPTSRRRHNGLWTSAPATVIKTASPITLPVVIPSAFANRLNQMMADTAGLFPRTPDAPPDRFIQNSRG